MIRNPTRFILAAGLLSMSGCASREAGPMTSSPEASEATRDGYMKRGPTLTLDEHARLADPTTLVLLEEKTQELARQRKKVEELEAQLAEKAGEMEQFRQAHAARQKEREQLEQLLKDATEHERAAVERALAADIARLKMEQELLRLKLGNLAGENSK